MSKTISVDVHISRYVEVDVDLGDFDTQDLVDELRSRSLGGIDLPADGEQILQRLHIALKLGRDAEALTLAREYVGEAMNVIL